MQINIVAPINPQLNTGNRTTARRWAKILKSLGHRVRVIIEYDCESPDLLIVLHARRGATAVRRFRKLYPHRPLLLTLTGTDLYRDIHRSQTARQSLQLADRLILLQPQGLAELADDLQSKCRVILQSASPPRNIPQPLQRVWEVCVIGHLRSVKDPFRTAFAARELPAESRIRVGHFGAALTSAMQKSAAAEMKINPRYRWFGLQPHWKTMQRLARSRLLVLTSTMEGGAHVVTEAIVAGVPVISTRISGSIGLLGDDHPGYFEVGHTQQLTALLARAETDFDFYDQLKATSVSRQSLFQPSVERSAWRELLAEFG